MADFDEAAARFHALHKAIATADPRRDQQRVLDMCHDALNDLLALAPGLSAAPRERLRYASVRLAAERAWLGNIDGSEDWENWDGREDGFDLIVWLHNVIDGVVDQLGGGATVTPLRRVA